MKNDRPSDVTTEHLRNWLVFYEELGLAPFYRRQRTPSPEAEPAGAEHLVRTPTGDSRSSMPKEQPPTLAGTVAGSAATLSLFGEAPGRVEADTVERIQADLGDCQRCQLASHRTKIVFGVGNPQAQLVFVGEAPGAEEDVQGLPFVGRAGQLLNHWLESLGMKREQVYICNVIKCRPPGNRSPEREEIETCSPFLLRQLDAIRPKLICCLGSVALQTLLGKNLPITRVRGQFFDYRGTKLFATFHPAYLLRNPNANREVQEDLRKIRQFLSL